MWIDVKDKLPELNANVLVLVRTSTGIDITNQNQMVARYIPKFTEKAYDIDWSEYCDEKDTFYTPEGWYANTAYLGEDYENYFIDNEDTD